MVLYKMILPPIVLSAFPNTKRLPPFSLTYAVKFFTLGHREKKTKARISFPALALTLFIRRCVANKCHLFCYPLFQAFTQTPLSPFFSFIKLV